MKRLPILLYFSFLTLVCLAQEGYTISPSGKWLCNRNDFYHFNNIDTLANGGGKFIPPASAHANIVHLYNDGQTVLIIENNLLIRARNENYTYINRDTICRRPVEPYSFEMTADEKYILLTGIDLTKGHEMSKGFMQLFLLMKTGDHYDITDSIGTPEQGRFISGGDVGVNGTVIYRDNITQHWQFFRANEKGQLREFQMQKLYSDYTADIPDSCSHIFFTRQVESDYRTSIAWFRDNGNGYDSLEEILPRDAFKFNTCDFLAINGNLSIAPDGKTIAWICACAKKLHFDKNDPGYREQWVMGLNYSDGKWSSPQIYFDLNYSTFIYDDDFQREYTAITVRSNGIFCLRPNATFIWYPGLLPGKLPMPFNVSFYHASNDRREYGIHKHLVIEDTLTTGEWVRLDFLVENPGSDTMRLYYTPENSPYKITRPIPSVSTWNNQDFEPDIIHVSNYTSLVIIPPHEKAVLTYWTQFAYCGDEFDMALASGAPTYGEIILRATAEHVVSPAQNKMIGNSNYANGKVHEEFVYDSTVSLWRLKRYYKSGNLCMVVWFDKDGKLAGDNLFMSDSTGITGDSYIVKRITISRNKITRRTYHSTEQIASQQTFKEGREIGTSQTWFPDGSLKSEAKFRTHLVFNIYTYRLKIEPVAGSSAKYYREYYSNGQMKYTAYYSWSGYRHRTWHYFGADGKLLASCSGRKQKCSGSTLWLSNLPPLYYPGYISLYGRGGGPGKF